MNAIIKILLVDDQENFRTGLKQLIESEPDMKVIGEARDGVTALEHLHTVRPEVIIMDVHLPGINGVDAGRLLLEREPRAKIVFFTQYDNPDYIARSLEIGASGYILKDAGSKVFLSAIRTVYRGRYYFAGDISDVLIRKYIDLQKERNTRSAVSGEIALSKREEQILRMIDKDLSNKEIAEALSVSVRTIEAHRLNILRKCQASNIEEVLARLDLDIDALPVEGPGEKPI